jgi:hypothetical protein
MTFSIEAIKAHIELNQPINDSMNQQRLGQYQERAKGYLDIFEGINYIGGPVHQADYEHFKYYFLIHYILEQKLVRLNGEARQSQKIADEKLRVVSEKAILDEILNEARYQSESYRKLKEYLKTDLEEKAAHRDFLMSRFGKFCAISFALGNGLGLGMVGYIIAEKLSAQAFMIVGLSVGFTVLAGINLLALYFNSAKADASYKRHLKILFGLDLVALGLVPCAHYFDFLPYYSLALMMSSLLLGAYVTTQANFDVTRDNNQRILRKRYHQQRHKSDVNYTLTEKMGLFSAVLVVFVSSLVGGLFTYDLVLDLLINTPVKTIMTDEIAMTLSGMLGVGSFFTIGIVFYEFAKEKTLSASNVQYLVLLKNLILAKNVKDVTIPDNLKSAVNEQSIAQRIIDAKSACANVSEGRNYLAIFTTFVLPAAVVAGAIFQQFVVVEALADILKDGMFHSSLAMGGQAANALSYGLCITAGMGYMYMFVPAAITTFIKIAYSVPRVGGYDELSSEGKVRYQLKRAGNTVMNGLEATLGGMFLTGDPMTLTLITLVAMMTSFVMSDIEGERDRVTDKLATCMDNVKVAQTQMRDNTLVQLQPKASSSVTYAYSRVLARGLEGCCKLDANGRIIHGEHVCFKF